MREFRYSALTATGQTVSGIRQAPSAEHLASDLLEQGLVLLKSRPTLGSLGQVFSGASRAGRRELHDFTQHMSTCLAAGIPAVTALGDFEKMSKGTFGEVIADIRSDVSSGTQLDESFARHSEVFPPVYLAMVSAGQKSGNLDGAFAELVAYLEWTDNLRAQTTQAMIYPAILLTGITGLFLLMMLFVMPRFEAIFNDVDFELPVITRRMLALGDFLGHWWWLIGLTVATVVIGAKLFFRTDRGAFLRDKMLLRMPVVGTFVRKIALSRFAKSFSLIFASGLDLLRLLQLLEGVVGNAVMARQLAVIRSRVSSGESLTSSFADATVFPPLIQRLVAVGEKTGSLDTSLMQASLSLDKEVPRDLKKAFTVFEALIIAILGVLVCVAALSLLMPIMQIKGSMG